MSRKAYRAAHLEQELASQRRYYERHREEKKRREREHYARMTVAQKTRKISLITQRRRRNAATQIREALNGIQG